MPDVKVSVFEDFLIWLYAYKLSLDKSKSVDAIIDLAVFGEIYLIHHLINQISDALISRLDNNIWKPTPNVIFKVYRNVPSGSILRQLCSHGFRIVSTG